MMNLFELLKSIPLNEVLRERIGQLQADILKLEQKKSNAEKKLGELEEKHLELIQEYEEYRASHEQFVEVKGMKFKRLESGAYGEIPYCINPLCHNAPMSVVDDFGYAVCFQCKYKVQTNSGEVRHIAESLSHEK